MRRTLAAALLAATAALAAPATASALSCLPPNPLAELEASDAAFVGQVLERREDTAIVSVLEGFKGVTTGEVVEIVTGRADPPPSMTSMLTTVGMVAGVYASRNAEGRLTTTVCPFAFPDAMRRAAALKAQGRTCTGGPPRLVWVVPKVTGRELSLRIVVADGAERAHTVTVQWGAQFGVEGLPRTTRRVPRAKTLLVRHRYPGTGAVQVDVAVAPRPPQLCGVAPRTHRRLSVQFRGARSRAT